MRLWKGLRRTPLNRLPARHLHDSAAVNPTGERNLGAVRRRQRPSTGVQPREALYRLQAEICRVMGHPRRLAILDLLGDGEKSTAALLRALRVSKVNLSQHLAVMKNAGVVVSRREGREMFYRLAYPEIKDACRLTREVLALRLEQSSRLARALDSAATRSLDTSRAHKGL